MQRTGFTPALWVALFTCWFLASCSSTPPPQKAEVDLSAIQTPQQWLDLAEQSAEPQKSTYRLNAAGKLLRSGRAEMARKILNSTQAASPDAKQRWLLISTQLYLAQGEQAQAKVELEQIQPNLLSGQQKNRYYAVSAALARMDKNYWQAAQAMALRYPYASNAQRPQLQQRLWNMLQKAEESQPTIPLEEPEAEFKGWLTLYQILHGEGELHQVLAQLRAWQSEYVNHPARAMLPTDFESALLDGGTLPESIAVILPLSGKYKEQGLAIRNGLLQAILTEENSATRLQFYDSGRHELAQIYQEITEHQHGLILGPLLKSNVQTLLQLNEAQLPVLALNQVDSEQQASHVNYFALTPESDARNAAAFMQQEGIQHPLMLQSGSSSFQRISRAFTEDWQDSEQNDSKFDAVTIASEKTMQKQLREVMDVTASRARSKQLATDLGLELESEPRSRADIDAVYLAASPQQARLLKTFVDVTLSPFAKPVKILVGPRSHNGNRGEFDNIYVADIPLIQRNEYQPLRAELRQLAPEWNYSDWRLFAMGYDAFSLIRHLTAMRQLSGYSISGLTGELSVSSQGGVSTRLHWGRYLKGELSPLAN